MRAEVRLSWAEARMARPIRVRPTKKFSSVMATTVTTTTNTWKYVIWAPPIANALGVPGRGSEQGDIGKGDLLGPEDGLGQVLQQDRHADGRDERRQPGCVPQRPIRQPLDGHPHGADHRHRDEHRQEEAQAAAC